MDILITLDNKRQIKIGTRNEDMLILPRDEKEHLYRSGCKSVKEARDKGLSAWGIDAEIFDKLLQEGLKVLKVVTKKKQYIISTDKFNEHKMRLHYKPYRPQYFCNEKEWTILGNQTQLVL